MANFSNNINLTLPDTGEFPGEWGPPINANFVTLDDLFGTGGHAHTGVAGDGPRIDHADLINAGTNTHAEIDTHIADTSIHQDTRIAAVESDDLVDQVFNVTNLRFANATVEEIGGGIALITPSAGGGTTELDPLTAPVVHFDTFSSEPGRPLSQQCWKVIRPSEFGPEYVTRAIYETPGVGAEMIFTNPQQTAGFVTNVLEAPVPHSKVQRTGVVVDKYGPTDGVVDNDDYFGLYLHLLASDRETSVSASLNVELGLSFAMIAVFDPGINDVVIKPRIFVRTTSGVTIFDGAIPGPQNWTNPNGGSNWTNLPLEYFVGQHEFSLSVEDQNRENFVLHYYYNRGLIWKKEFTSSDGAFYDALFDLISELQSRTSPTSTSDYGHFGFSTVYRTEMAKELTFAINCSMSASIGEQATARLVGVPTSPPDPPGEEVCGGDPNWAGITVGGFFDPDGTGPEPPWRVVGVFAGPPEGFIIENAAGNQQIIYCDPPNEGGENTPIDQRSNAGETSLVEGNNLPIGDFSDIRFIVGNENEIPINWQNGYNTVEGYYSAGDELPSDFVTAINVERNTDPATGNFNNQLIVESLWGNRLPWNAKVDLEVDPLYAGAAFTATWPEAFNIRAGVPDVNQVAVYAYEPGSGWLRVDNANPVTEGASVLAVVAGNAIPLGPNFWSPGNGFDSQYGIDDTVGASGNALVVDGGTAHPFEVLWTSITQGRVNTGAGTVVNGVPPRDPVASEEDPGVSFAKSATNEEAVVIIGNLDINAWNGGAPQSVVLELRDTETPQQFNDVVLVRFNLIRPRPPQIDPSQTNISTTAADSSAELTVTVLFPDRDTVIELLAGFTTLGDITRENATITPGAVSEQWVITGLTTASSGNITIRAKNVAAEAAYGNGTADLTVGVINSTPGNTPAVTYNSGTLVEDTTSVITFDTTESTLEPNAYVTMDSEFFTIEESLRGVDSWTLTVTTVDLPGGNSLPTPTASATWVNPGAATATTVGNIPCQEAVAPVLVSAELDEAGSGITTWDIGVSDVRAIYLTINNTSQALLNLADISLVNQTGTLNAVIEQRFAFSDTSFAIRVRLNNPGESGDSFGIQVSNTTAGDPLTSTLDPAITMSDGISVGNLQGAFTAIEEGRYFEFNIPGSFATNNTVIVDFRTAEGESILHPSDPTPLINTVTGTLISGSARVAPDTAGTGVYLYIEYQTGGANVTVLTSEVVAEPPTPFITDFVLSPSTEGSTGSVITVNGANLAAPASPAGEPPLAFAYDFFDDDPSTTVLTNVTLTSATSNTLTFSANIAAGTGGSSVGMTIDYLGGNVAEFPNLANILSESGGDPVITGFTINDGSSTGFGPVNSTQTLTIEGSGLSAANVAGEGGASGVQFSVNGFEDDVNDAAESAPGAGTHPAMFRSLYSDVDIITQSDTQIVARITFGTIYAGTRLRVHLLRPASHPLGAGEWPQDNIDQITPSDPENLGLTIQGPTSTALQLNAVPSEGTTRLDTARALQAALAPNSEGTTFTILMRLNQIPASTPVVLPVSDNLYGTTLRNISVATTANPFEFNVTATVPTPAQTPGYPDGSFNTVNQTVVGLQLSNGIPIAAGIVNATSWSTPADDAGGLVPA